MSHSDTENGSSQTSNVRLVTENSGDQLQPSNFHATSNNDFLNFLQTNTSKCKENGEVRKGRKGKDFCFFCENLVLNFARHIQRNHLLETEVQKIFSLPAGSKERKNLLTLLRKKGNYLNSNNICKPIKQPNLGGNLLPCTHCLGFYAAKQLWRHRKKCVGAAVKTHQSDAQNFLIKNLRIDPQLIEKVFPRMRPDEASLVAK